MDRGRGRLALALLVAFGAGLGLLILEAGARLSTRFAERRQGRLDRDLGAVKVPDHGSTATLGQMILKSSNPEVVYELRPRLDVAFAGGRVTTNDAGYRGSEVSPPSTPDRFRIAGIGDSYMFGQGVSDDETYLARLPALLGSEHSATRFETANLAVPGFNTTMEVALLESRVEALHPDVIVIEIVGNDLDLPNFLWDETDLWSMRRSFLLDFVRGRLRGARSGGAGGGLAEAPRPEGAEDGQFAREGADRVPPRYRAMVGIEAFRRSVARLAATGRRVGAPVLAMTHGVWFEDDMLATLQKEGIPVLVLRSALRQRARELGAPDYARSPLALSPRDLHPSAIGHEVIARELATWLPSHASGLVPAGPS